MLALLLVMAAGTTRAEPRGYWISALGAPSTMDSGSAYLNSAGQVAGNVNGQAVIVTNGTTITIGRAGTSGVADLNDDGQVLGADGLGNFLYDAGTYYDLSADGMATVRGLASGGFVAGTVRDAVGNDHAAIWHGHVVTPIYTLLAQYGEVHSEAHYVNAQGQAAGLWWDAAGAQHLFVYATGNIVRLPMTEFIDEWDASRSLNDKGMVVGFRWDAGNKILVQWDPQTSATTDIAASYGSDDLRGRSFNAHGDISGNFNVGATGEWRGYVHTNATKPVTYVASLGGSTCSHGINNNGDSVGHSWYPGDHDYQGVAPGAAVLYTGGKVYDVNKLIPPNSGFILGNYSGQINDLGQLLLDAYDSALGSWHMILLTPNPVSAVSYAGTLRATDGFYTTNVTGTQTATARPTGVSEVHYRLDSGAWVTAAGASTTFSLSSNGTHRVSVYAVDAQGHAEVTQDQIVSIDKGGVVITTRTLPGAIVGAAYRKAIAVKGGSGSYAYTIVSGSGVLPPGLTLSASGTISGTVSPTAAAGTYWFQVQATDAKKASSTSYLSIELVNPLAITTPASVSFAGGPVGLTATGGKEPYTWTPASALPKGLVFDHATIWSGSAKLPVTASFKVTDSNTPAASKTFTVTLQP
jgi:hypothetical protein